MAAGRSASIALLRVSVGGLFVVWGLDKFVNPGHAQAVSDAFYLGLLSHPSTVQISGVLQVSLGVLVIVGWLRRFLYPLQAVMAVLGAIAVWRSIIDPWGWYLESTNALFYPSLIIAGAALVLLTTQDMDHWSLDHKLHAKQ